MHKKALLALLILLAALAVCPAAGAASEMPDKLAAEFELYPGATVTDTTDSPMVVQAVLDCGEASKQEVFDFYKEQVTKGDWKHLVEREVKGKLHLMFSNPTVNGNIAVENAGGETTVTISLMKSFTPRSN